MQLGASSEDGCGTRAWGGCVAFLEPTRTILRVSFLPVGSHIFLESA